MFYGISTSNFTLVADNSYNSPTKQNELWRNKKK